MLTLVDRLSDTVLLNVEIKDMYHDTVDQTVQMLHDHGLADRSVIACFDAQILRYTKKAHPEMRCQGFPGDVMQSFDESTYDCMFGMGISISGKNVTDESIRHWMNFCREKGILAWLYCADTEEDVRKCVAFGCDNITGNDPCVALETLRKMGLHR